MTLTAPGWRVTPISLDGVPTLLVEQHTPHGWMLPGDRGTGYYATPEQVCAVIGEEAFAALQPA